MMKLSTGNSFVKVNILHPLIVKKKLSSSRTFYGMFFFKPSCIRVFPQQFKATIEPKWNRTGPFSCSLDSLAKRRVQPILSAKNVLCSKFEMDCYSHYIPFCFTRR